MKSALNRFFIGVIILLLGTAQVNSQIIIRDPHHATFRRAMNASDVGDFSRAIELFQSILVESPQHIDALTQLGMSYMFSHQNLDSAIVLFDKVLEIIPEDDAFNEFGIYIQHAKSRAYRLMNQPSFAIPILEQLRDSVQDTELKDDFSLELKQARHAAILVQNPVPLKITSIGDVINSEFDDHSPLVCLTGNRVFFTSRRPVPRERAFQDGQYAEKIFVSEYKDGQWQEPNLVRELYSRHEHISILSLSPDGTKLFLFMNDRYPGRNIYVSNLVNGLWQEPEMLPAPINSEWDETHASLSPDQSTLFFTSNRPGGYGGLDIYKVRMNEKGDWGEPVNLGPNINTEFDEETPKMHPDGLTLYFSSEGHNSIGGFDVFYTQKLPDGSWAGAVNMGVPVNSADDDYFFVPTLDKSQAYFASYRFSGKKARSDIYRVSFDEQRKGSLAVVEGYVSDDSGKSGLPIRILVWRDDDSKMVGDYRPNRQTGRYLLFLEAGESYRIEEVILDEVVKSRAVYIPEELTYEREQNVVLLQELSMESPLKREIERFEEQEPIFPHFYMTEIIDEPRSELYTVQILALLRNPNPADSFFSGLDKQNIRAYKGKDGFIRFVAGEFSSEEDAEEFLENIRRSGKYHDAWIRELPELKAGSEEEWMVMLD
ncbi:WD40 repeat protein [Natronoflexus pectinivorans]|uniref:WD40 repeat protein n=1 Tax=Natronoflexus pectinivorans TaxID=682526 RepID=A0A4R2GHF5_9BACT|nr:WD40 repeat protein [Natronoflexus pectinivorans]